jgi:hypothetical protein
LANGNYFLYAFGVFSVIISYRAEGKTATRKRRLLNYMFEECKEFFEAKIGESYGDYSQIDHKDFLKFILDQKLVIDDLPYDLEELIDEFIQQDRVYKQFLN